MGDAARAEERKRVGNEAFSKGKLEAAIEAYSEAICFAPSEPVYYTNRAMCHRKKEQWDAVMADCRVALGLDDTSIKGHYLLGVALDANSDFGEATRHLWRALELCKERTISCAARRGVDPRAPRSARSCAHATEGGWLVAACARRQGGHPARDARGT